MRLRGISCHDVFGGRGRRKNAERKRFEESLKRIFPEDSHATKGGHFGKSPQPHEEVDDCKIGPGQRYHYCGKEKVQRVWKGKF